MAAHPGVTALVNSSWHFAHHTMGAGDSPLPWPGQRILSPVSFPTCPPSSDWWPAKHRGDDPTTTDLTGGPHPHSRIHRPHRIYAWVCGQSSFGQGPDHQESVASTPWFLCLAASPMNQGRSTSPSHLAPQRPQRPGGQRGAASAGGWPLRLGPGAGLGRRASPARFRVSRGFAGFPGARCGGTSSTAGPSPRARSDRPGSTGPGGGRAARRCAGSRGTCRRSRPDAAPRAGARPSLGGSRPRAGWPRRAAPAIGFAAPPPPQSTMLPRNLLRNMRESGHPARPTHPLTARSPAPLSAPCRGLPGWRRSLRTGRPPGRPSDPAGGPGGPPSARPPG